MRLRRVREITVTPTVTLSAYTAADVVGGLMTFAVTDQGFDGAIRRIICTDDANQKEQYVLYIFDSLPSTIANDAAFAPTYADLKLLRDKVTLATADWATLDGNAVAILGGHEDGAMEIPCHSDNGDLYMYAVATDTPDYVAATDISFIMVVEVYN